MLPMFILSQKFTSARNKENTVFLLFVVRCVVDVRNMFLFNNEAFFRFTCFGFLVFTAFFASISKEITFKFFERLPFFGQHHKTLRIFTHSYILNVGDAVQFDIFLHLFIGFHISILQFVFYTRLLHRLDGSILLKK